MNEKQILELLYIELRHLNYHIGDYQYQMFENETRKGNHPDARKKYNEYKLRAYQTERIISLIKNGWTIKPRIKQEGVQKNG